MKIVVYGLTITSSWGNGHATTYRALCKALAARGHHITFVEKNVEWYRNNRDLPSPPYCSVRLYSDWQLECPQLIEGARDADAIVIGSYFPDANATMRSLLHAGYGPVLFYDIDTPITVSALRSQGRCDYLDATLIPHYRAYLSFTGGPVLQDLQDQFHSPLAVPFYCSVDADSYKPEAVREEFRCDLSYLGTYASDRQIKLMQLLNGAAELLPCASFLVAGPLYPPATHFAENVRRVTHLPPPSHPAFYSSSRFTLNLTRSDMVAAGWSPSVRLFEASACGAAILSDWWPGLDQFFTPDEAILLPADADEVIYILRHFTEEQRLRIGRNARESILAQHTSVNRAQQFESIVSSL